MSLSERARRGCAHSQIRSGKDWTQIWGKQPWHMGYIYGDPLSASAYVMMKQGT